MIDSRFSDEDLFDLLQDAIEANDIEAQAAIQAELEWRWPMTAASGPGAGRA